MDKMREEFEAWAVNYNLARSDWGNYSDRHVNNMWKSWKASRAALCVELPRQWFDDGLDCDLMEAHQVGKALDEAGVQYK